MPRKTKIAGRKRDDSHTSIDGYVDGRRRQRWWVRIKGDPGCLGGWGGEERWVDESHVHMQRDGECANQTPPVCVDPCPINM